MGSIVQWTLLNIATSGQAKMAVITDWIYYPEFLFSKKSKFLYESGHINRLDILSVDILSGVYCTNNYKECWHNTCTTGKNLVQLHMLNCYNMSHIIDYCLT